MAWQGFDSGGVEQLWADEVIIGGLAILHEHEPFDRSDEKATFFDDLEEAFPEFTWRERDALGSFRPIFRRANPWVKLGLTSPESKSASLTALGLEVLSGEKTLQDVYIEATKVFEESDGTRSFAKMCQCALLLPDEVFSLEDVEFAVSRAIAETTEGYRAAIDTRRADDQRFPQNSRRTRALKRMMNSLVSAGAMMKVATGWKLSSTKIAQEILGSAVQSESVDSIVVIGVKAAFVPNIKTITPGSRPTRSISPSLAAKVDPIQRALLLERAHSAHETVVEKCADLIRELGGTPVEDLNSFDVACYTKPSVIFEAKSITPSNCYSQLRKAISQLPEYRWRHREVFTDDTALVIALNVDPREWLDGDFLDYIVKDRGISIIWPIDNVLIDSHGRAYREVLAP